jgi:peptide/nickel transport system permease protein
MMASAASRLILMLLLGWHLLLAALALLAPHPALHQYREFPGAPPTPIHWTNHSGQLAWPHVCAIVPDALDFGRYSSDCSQRYPLRFLIARQDGNRALVRAETPGHLFLLGTDEFGRDVFSRLLSGGLISVGSGLAATAVALAIASLLGGIAGYYGGLADSLLSRAAEFLMAAPLLYLLLAIRAALPIQVDPLAAFGIAVAVISLAGWARPARIVRGVVLSAKERGFVLAARGFGAGTPYLMRHHILPQTLPVLWTQAALLAPQFVLLEVTLAFFGLGVPEPTASWGSMLSSLRQYDVLASNWWMLSPAIAMTVSLLLFGSYAQTLETLRPAPNSATRERTFVRRLS